MISRRCAAQLAFGFFKAESIAERSMN